MQTLIQNWWLMALCGVLQAVYSVVILFMQNPDGPLALRQYALQSTVVFLGTIAIASGIFAVAAGMWKSSQGKSWLLLVNGVALSTLGFMLTGSFGPQVSFRSITLLLAVMAISISIFELRIARTLRQNHLVNEWFLDLAGAASVVFAMAFLAMSLRWIILQPSPASDFIWFGSYFGFSSISMLGISWRLHQLNRA